MGLAAPLGAQRVVLGELLTDHTHARFEPCHHGTEVRVLAEVGQCRLYVGPLVLAPALVDGTLYVPQRSCLVTADGGHAGTLVPEEGIGPGALLNVPGEAGLLGT